MELQQIRYVVALAEELSFTRAAERCFVVQSALSHQIKALEAELGVALFARSSRRVELTVAGAAFLTEARVSLEAAERAAAEATAASGMVTGDLTIGVIPTVTAINIPEVLGRFRDEYPSVRIRLRGGSSDEFVAAIGEGHMDIAVLGLPDSEPPRGVASRELARERLAAIVPLTHPLAPRHRLRLEELADHDFVDFPTGSSGRAQSDLAFHTQGIRREVMFEVMSAELMLGLVAQGLAIALLAPEAVGVRDDVRIIPVTGGPTRVEYLAWSDFNLSPAAQAFLNGLDENTRATAQNLLDGREA